MPKIYEAIRDKAEASGMSHDAAQAKAARIYNWMRKSHPGMEKLSNKPEGSKKVKIRVKKKAEK